MNMPHHSPLYPPHYLRGTSRAVLWIACAGIALSACTKIPELDRAVPESVRTADYPTLIALDASITSKAPPQKAFDDTARDLNARRDRLAQRAKRLKQRSE